MRYTAIALILAGVLLGIFAKEPLSFVEALFYLGPPMGVAMAFVVMRRYAPMEAFMAGSLIAMRAFVLFVLPAIFVSFLSGDLASDESCDAVCATNTGGFFLAVLLLTVSAPLLAVAGGIMSAIASLIIVRADSPSHS
jgi:hypothetical protein